MYLVHKISYSEVLYNSTENLKEETAQNIVKLSQVCEKMYKIQHPHCAH